MTQTVLELPAFEGIGSLIEFTLNNSAYASAGLFVAPKAGNISHVFISASSVTSPPSYRFGIEGVSSRAPDGTYLSSGNAYGDFTPSAGGAWYALGTAAVVTQGQNIAATVRYQSGTIGASNTMTILSSIRPSQQVGSPVSSNYTSSWSNGVKYPVVAAKYDDGEVIGYPVVSASEMGWHSGSNPRWRGMKFSPPIACEVVGVVLTAYIPQNVDIEVYDGTTLVRSVTVSITGSVSLYSAYHRQLFYFPSLTCAASGSYRFVIKPSTTTPSVFQIKFNWYDSASQSTGGASLLQYTTSNNASTWSDTSLGFVELWPIVRKWDSGSGGVFINSRRNTLIGR